MPTQQTILANLTALGFNNPSQAAFTNKIAEGLGIIVDNTLTEFANTQTSILNIINSQRYGKSGYYTSVALAFQYGDNLTIDPITLDDVYAVIDSTKQIVKRAAFENLAATGSSQLFLKIATIDNIGNLVALSAIQLEAFKNYFVNFEIPGLPVSIVSNDANALSFNANSTYFATYDLPTLQTNLANALTTFRQTFAFDGIFYAGDLEAYIKTNVPGIRDFYLFNTLIDGAAFSGNTILASGYFNYISTILNNINYLPINA